MLKEFGNIAKNLAYNPLGIIALFIVLCYAIASLLFGFSAEHLTSAERIPLIWFIILFPVIVLVAFVWLVTNHHTKLYAPKDFQDSSTYLRTLGIQEQIERIDKEAKDLEATAASTQESEELVESPGVQFFRKRIILAEDLAIRELESEFKTSIQRQVALGPDLPADGAFTLDGAAYLIEIKFITGDKISDSFINSLNQIQTYINQRRWKRMNVIVALVFDGPTLSPTSAQGLEQNLKSQLGDKVMLRSYNYQALVKKYGIE